PVRTGEDDGERTLEHSQDAAQLHQRARQPHVHPILQRRNLRGAEASYGGNLMTGFTLADFVSWKRVERALKESNMTREVLRERMEPFEITVFGRLLRRRA